MSASASEMANIFAALGEELQASLERLTPLKFAFLQKHWRKTNTIRTYTLPDKLGLLRF
jgi:hypothetical protein